jgi:hypothetical protein
MSVVAPIIAKKNVHDEQAEFEIALQRPHRPGEEIGDGDRDQRDDEQAAVAEPGRLRDPGAGPEDRGAQRERKADVDEIELGPRNRRM